MNWPSHNFGHRVHVDARLFADREDFMPAFDREAKFQIKRDGRSILAVDVKLEAAHLTVLSRFRHEVRHQRRSDAAFLELVVNEKRNKADVSSTIRAMQENGDGDRDVVDRYDRFVRVFAEAFQPEFRRGGRRKGVRRHAIAATGLAEDLENGVGVS
jgi:hypothetical protein